MAVAAVDLGGTKIVAARVDSRGRLGRRIEQPVDASSLQAPIDQIVALVGALNAGTKPVSAAGISVPGLVRPNGTVWAPNLPGWHRVALARILRRRLRVPVVVESDRNASVLGEAWRGAARGKRDVVVLMVGTGIGAGILSGGRIVRGAHELSGCAGWMVVTERTNDSTARVGSLESHAAGPAVARAAGKLSALDAAAAARAGDARARRAFAAAGQLLGSAVANLISLFDPEVLVLTGGLATAADLFLAGIKATAVSRAQPLSARQVAIVMSRLGSDANLLGAARIALSNLEGSLDER
jgi:glucokinase